MQKSVLLLLGALVALLRPTTGIRVVREAPRPVPVKLVAARAPPTPANFRTPAKPLKIRTPATFRAPENPFPPLPPVTFRLPGMPTKETAPTSYFSSSGATLREPVTFRVPATGLPPNKTPCGNPYWFDERIHNFGNVGLGGRIHALFAPLATRIIDATSYGGVDVRRMVQAAIPRGTSVLDLCCGVGYSTAPGAVGVDTSSCFLDAARLLQLGRNATFVRGNAETYGKTLSHDVVTLMFATHEMPREARQRVLANACRIARRQVVVVDIDPEFKLALTTDPQRAAQAKAFLSGEPYALDYLAAIDTDVVRCARERGWQSSTQAVLPGHVRMWTLSRASLVYGAERLGRPSALDWGI